MFAKGQVTFPSFVQSQTLITPKFVVPRKWGSFLPRITTATLNKHDEDNLFSAPVLLAHEGCTPHLRHPGPSNPSYHLILMKHSYSLP